MKLFIYIFILVFTSFISPQTNNPYVHKGPLGKKVAQKDTIPKRAFDFIPISKWIGERFIFLPQPKYSQKLGYQNFNVSYHKYVGRIAKVISVNESDYTTKVIFKMEDNGKKLSATAYSESIRGIASIADIDSARSRWLNKTLWFKKNELSVYDERKDKVFGFKIAKCSPVKVIDIVAGWLNIEPVRFILRTPSGDEGFVDINLSGTNVSLLLRHKFLFDDIFFTQDPKKTFHWSAKVWDLIEAGKVSIGMTDEQVKLSWGKPKEINQTYIETSVHEQWVYPSEDYLYFEDGVLTQIRN